MQSTGSCGSASTGGNGAGGYVRIVITVPSCTNPTISAQPTNQSVCENGNTSFSLTASNVDTYQWQYWDGSTWQNTNGAGGVSGHNTNILSFTGTPIGYNGIQLRCVLSKAPSCQTISNVVTIAVKAAPTDPTDISPKTACPSTSVTLTASGGSIGDGATYEWGTGSVIGSNIIAGATSATYTTPVLVSNTTYWVRRKGTAPCSNTTGGVSQQITVTATPAPTGSGTQTFCSGATLADIVVTGSNIQWYNAASGGTLLPNSTVLVNGTHYYASQTAGCESTTRLDVLITVNTVPSAVTVSGGGTFCNTATLTASGGSGGTIYWQNTTSNGTSTVDATSSKAVTSSGTYYFRAKNAANCWSTQGSATVTINTPPVIGTQPVSVVKLAGQTATFTVSASGATSYQWQKNGVNLSNAGKYSGVTTATLTVTNVSTTEEGNYTCVITNTCGSTTTVVVTLQIGTLQTVTITSSGSWTVPSCATEITVKTIGAGGGGGGARSQADGGSDACSGGGGGGGGGYSQKTFSVIPNDVYTVTVGTGGTGGTASSVPGSTGIDMNTSSPGGNGGNSSFSGHGENIIGNGGIGGKSASARKKSSFDSNQYAQAEGGAGGASSGGTINYTGGKGSYGFPNGSKDHGSAGGGAAGVNGNGGNPTVTYSGNPADNGSGPNTENETRLGGIGNGPNSGKGANGVDASGSDEGKTGNPGNNYGGGGGGGLVHGKNSSAVGANGGKGGDGVVIIEYVAVAPVQPVLQNNPSNICQGIKITYTIASVSGATGYTWGYTGTGVTITNNGTSADFLFGNNATSGNLTVQATGTCGNSTTLSVPITLSPTSDILSGNNEPKTCYVSGNNPIHFYHSSGRYIGSINPNGRSGTLTMTSYINTWGTTPGLNDGTIYAGCVTPSGNELYRTAYMKRAFRIKDENTPSALTAGADVNVYFPFTQGEYSDLATRSSAAVAGVGKSAGNPNDNVTSLGSIVATKYNGTNEDDNAANNCTGGTSVVVAQQASGALSATGYALNPAVTKNNTGATETVNYAYFKVPSFSEFHFHGINNNSPLPIKLTSFAGSCEEKGVILSWTTATETNVSHFVIERSRNGQTWEVVSTINAVGNSSTANTYQAIDENGFDMLYYRLRSIDNDGTSETFNPIAIQCNVEKETWNLYPIPASSQVTLNVLSDKEYDTELSIFDVNGKLITANVIHVEKGVNHILVDVQNFAKGAYIFKLDKETNYKPLKMIKVD